MKKVIIFTAFAFLTISAFAQTKKDSTQKGNGETAVGNFAPPASRQFFILLDETEIHALYDFITNADIYSEKGRAQYLAFLDKHVHEVPKRMDTQGAKREKPKK